MRACWMKQEEPVEPRKAACQWLAMGIFLLFFQLRHRAQQTAGNLKVGVGKKGTGIKQALNGEAGAGSFTPWLLTIPDSWKMFWRKWSLWDHNISAPICVTVSAHTWMWPTSARFNRRREWDCIDAVFLQASWKPVAGLRQEALLVFPPRTQV